MAEREASLEHSCHVLDFFYDENDSCALTVSINRVRFHIIVDTDELKGSDSESLLQDYLNRLRAFKNEEEKETNLETTKKDGNHTDLNDSQAMADGSLDASREGSSTPGDRDSAVDLTADQDGRPKDAVGNKTASAETELQNWILSAFGEETKRLAPGRKRSRPQTIYDWYYGETHFYEFKVEQQGLIPQKLEESGELREKMDALVPRIPLPKYIRDKDVPWLQPGDIEVISEIQDPKPSHPGEVKVGEEIQFFKPVDPSQPQTTNREIKILMDIADAGLHDEIHVPKLLGLVSMPESNLEIMGFLLTNIPNAQPLTTLLDSDVAEEKRMRWADDSKSLVQSLHKHGIVWGDAKADNFMVDEDDTLWIIDFGGSYTEGWVDPELSETKSGDQMGLDKVVDALVDPDENTFDPEDEDEEDGDYSPPQASKKRKRSADGEDEERQEDPLSRGDRRYCYCDGGSSGQMVACDGAHCAREWFHLDCLGLDSPPKSETWYCDRCSAGPEDGDVAADGFSRNKTRRRN